jgi:hypothetical protein
MLQIIVEALKNIYLEEPNQEKWNDIAAGFKNNKYFPNCMGAVDRKTYSHKEAE